MPDGAVADKTTSGPEPELSLKARERCDAGSEYNTTSPISIVSRLSLALLNRLGRLPFLQARSAVSLEGTEKRPATDVARGHHASICSTRGDGIAPLFEPLLSVTAEVIVDNTNSSKNGGRKEADSGLGFTSFAAVPLLWTAIHPLTTITMLQHIGYMSYSRPKLLPETLSIGTESR